MRIHRHRQRRPKLKIPKFKVNEGIKAEEVRIIDAGKEDLGVMTIEAALAMAAERSLDLVEVSPKAKPPVCKILDYGHFKYQKEKEARKQKAQSKEVEIKGIRLSVRIGDHDMDVRRKRANKFLDRGDKLKVEIVLRGREKAHKHVANAVIEKFLGKIKEDYPIRIEQPLTYQHGRISIIIARV